jgi:hypothetical protein
MVRQVFDLYDLLVPSTGFQGFDNASMQRTPPLVEEAAIGHLVRQGVFEGVDLLGHQARLVEQLGALEVHQALLQRRLGQLGNGLQQWHGHLRTDHGSRLQQVLRLGG